MVVPGPPVITYSMGDTVYEDELVTLSCVSETQEPAMTDVLWLLRGEVVEGEKVVGLGTVTNSMKLQASLADNDLRYECQVVHVNLPEPLIAYAHLTGTCTVYSLLFTVRTLLTLCPDR